MPTRTTAPRGAPCWVDLMTSDVDKSRTFYSALFGWTAEEPSEEFGGYFMFTKDGAPVAGGMGKTPEMQMPDTWTIYLTADNGKQTVEAATATGGQALTDTMEVADLGTMAMIGDPTGAAIGLWQPNTFHGFPTFGETGTPSWFELLTREYDHAIEFYRDVFKWQTKEMGDTPEFRYTVLVDGEEMFAGIMDASAFLPEGVPAHWSVYFGVADTDAALAKAVELGGSIVVPAEDTPYGRLATAADPTGANFKLVAPNEAMPARQAAS